MKWNKLGLVYAPEKNKPWNQLYAMMPTPIYLKDQDIIRVYFGSTDVERFGRSSFIDVDANNPARIVHKSAEYVLDIGKPGTFDDAGAIASSIIEVEKQQFLYYVGFQRTQKVPYMLFSGLAIAENWVNFEKYSVAPIIDRSANNPYSNAAPFVLYDEAERKYKMWFWLGKEWVSINNKLYINAEIHYATSGNGKDWKLENKACIIPDPATEFSVGRPWVIKEKNKYKMFYSVRYIDKLYRLAYAESENGMDWVRKDDKMGIDVSDKGWDSEMVCYPAVISVKNKTYLFYNGNNNGETGFGVAELAED